MNKEQAIKNAWVELVGEDNFQQLNLVENGFSDWRCRKIVPQHLWNKLYDRFKTGSSRKSGLDLIYRPKSLKGLEDNNGWNKITSPKDLPKTEGLYLFLIDGREVRQWVEEGVSFSNLHTHWRDIVNLPKPLY